jgi:hypothetical protein
VPSYVNHLPRFRGIASEGLLAEYGFPSLKADKAVFLMHEIRGGDIDDIDVPILDEFLMTLVPARYAILLGERLRISGRPRTHGE